MKKNISQKEKIMTICLQCGNLYDASSSDVLIGETLCENCVISTRESCLITDEDESIKGCDLCNRGISTKCNCIAIVWSQSTNCVCRKCLLKYEGTINLSNMQ